MATIIVCNKFPQNLQLEAVINGKVHKFTLNGSKSDAPMGQMGSINNSLYGATAMSIVDEDLFKAWAKDNQQSALIKNGIVFTANDEKSAKAVKKERSKEKTGLEGLKVDKNADGDSICTDDRARKA